MPSWSRNILNRHVAPDISDFTSATIPDLRLEFPEWGHWVANHFLNNVLRGPFKGSARQYSVNFIRRSQATFKFYHQAKDLTVAYLQDNNPHNPNVTRYYEIVTSWEVAFMNWSICLDIVRHLGGKPVFAKKDGSSEQRTYDLNNTIKHHATDISNGLLAGDDILPFWLTPTGFQSKSDELSYIEFSDLVRDVAKLSTELQDARTFLGRG
jgi:hypothetical protein